MDPEMKAMLLMMLDRAKREVEATQPRDMEDIEGVESDLPGTKDKSHPDVMRLKWDFFELAWTKEVGQG